MITTQLLLAVALLAGIVLAWALLGKRPAKPRLPYTKRPSLLTAGELRFYRVLLRAVPSEMMIFVKVRLMDVVAVADDAWRELGSRGSGMHVDFVVADSATLGSLLVIELDDKSHWQTEAKERDAFKDAILDAAGVPVLRVRAAGRYDVAELRAKILRIVY